MKKIILTKGECTIVDDRDFARLSKNKWHVSDSHGYKYAVRETPRSQGRRKIFMHREILDLARGQGIVDHKNHNTLDNRRCNLRVTDRRGNASNRRKARKLSTGVYYRPDCSKHPYVSSVYLDGSQHYLGAFKTPTEAAKARKEALSGQDQ